MHTFLSPGIRLLGRYGFARKFQLLFLLFMLPLAGSLWMLGQDFRSRLAVIDGERTGVRQLLALDNVDAALSAQRNRAARWKAVDILRQPTPQAREALAAFEAGTPGIAEALAALRADLLASGASAEIVGRFDALQASTQRLDVNGLRQVGWWPDGYEQFTASLTAVQALRESIAKDSRLILDPWLETYLLMQIATQQVPDLVERVGRLASIGQASAVAGQFSLQSRLQLRDLRSRMGDARDQLQKTGASLQERLPEQMGDWAAQYEKTRQGLDTELKAVDEGLFGGDIKLASGDFERSLDNILQGQVDLRRQSLRSLDARLEHYHRQAISDVIPVVLTFALLLLAALYLFVCLQASIRRSASGITRLAESLRDGDLSVQAPVHGHDELATISSALNAAVVQLRTTLLGVNHETVALSGAVLSLNEHARGTLTEVEAQQLQISQIAAAATQLAATSQGVARSCEQASGSAQQTRQIAQQSSLDSQRTTSSIQQLNQRLGDTAQALGRVSDQGQQIQSVVDAIRSIAEQTNLLALNAAIEAARAGEQGRGFAVVADEVRSLSQRTQASTGQIASTVESLRSTVKQAVDLMQVACGQAATDADSVMGLGERLGEIASAVQGVTDTLAQIATAVDEQAATADEVSSNIQQVDQAALRLLDGARAVNLAADRLGQGSRTLNENTARFTLG